MGVGVAKPFCFRMLAKCGYSWGNEMDVVISFALFVSVLSDVCECKDCLDSVLLCT